MSMNTGEPDSQKIHVVNALDLLHAETNFRSGPIFTFCQDLDRILGGGVPCGKITEIYGDKGTGKTSFCYQVALDVQIPPELGGLGGQALFIDTMNTFNINRVKEMATACAEHCRRIEPGLSISRESLVNGIHYIKCGTHTELLDICKELDSYVSSNNIKLIVIDSLASLYYCEDFEFDKRGKSLYILMHEFCRLANKYHLAILVTNSMTTRFKKNGLEYKIPFLGEAWTYVPNLRIELKKGNNQERIATLVKSTSMPSSSAQFTVTCRGLRS